MLCLGKHLLLRWLPRAGREMVFVINREFQDYNETRSFKSVASDIAFKFSCTFRFGERRFTDNDARL